MNYDLYASILRHYFYKTHKITFFTPKFYATIFILLNDDDKIYKSLGLQTNFIKNVTAAYFDFCASPPPDFDLCIKNTRNHNWKKEINKQDTLYGSEIPLNTTTNLKLLANSSPNILLSLKTII
jgi:hypothetical protein